MSASALYNRDILRLAASLEEGTALAPPASHAERRSPTCGSRVTLWVKRDGQGRIEQLSADIASCALGQASAAMLLRDAPGMDRAAVAAARDAWADHLSGTADQPGFADAGLLTPARDYPARHPAILLPWNTLLAALDQPETAA